MEKESDHKKLFKPVLDVLPLVTKHLWWRGSFDPYYGILCADQRHNPFIQELVDEKSYIDEDEETEIESHIYLKYAFS